MQKLKKKRKKKKKKRKKKKEFTRVEELLTRLVGPLRIWEKSLPTKAPNILD